MTTIELWKEPWCVDRARIPPDFAAIVRSNRLAQGIKTSLSLGASVLAALSDGVLAGYATIVPASALVGERWHDVPDLFELGAIEVARCARRRGVAKRLLERLGDATNLRASIVMARAFAWHWDFVQADLTPPRYRRMLISILARAGFVHHETDDPEVAEHPLNFLATRVGEEVRSASLLAFTERLRA